MSICRSKTKRLDRALGVQQGTAEKIRTTLKNAGMSQSCADVVILEVAAGKDKGHYTNMLKSPDNDAVTKIQAVISESSDKMKDFTSYHNLEKGLAIAAGVTGTMVLGCAGIGIAKFVMEGEPPLIGLSNTICANGIVSLVSCYWARDYKKSKNAVAKNIWNVIKEKVAQSSQNGAEAA